MPAPSNPSGETKPYPSHPLLRYAESSLAPIKSPFFTTRTTGTSAKWVCVSAKHSYGNNGNYVKYSVCVLLSIPAARNTPLSLDHPISEVQRSSLAQRNIFEWGIAEFTSSPK
ncbi:hypothetical protein CISG_02521 [Coccidioides immitis RMSCC 3703]|uniref:Uncharacterized protein n=1 Tax=Coccidioides immitis RMSCC 3703 TaxID=454286 RepID=A0A0J8R818_COCIT|nr:hypothetical protein CISG_02521 [Coccidioides immitis RMSCC 3703]